MRLDANLIAYCGLTLLALAALADWADPGPSAGGGCRVMRVVDGDTVEMTCAGRAETARLVGLDTPEMEGRCPQEAAAARDARRALAAMVAGADEVQVVVTGRDRYGRVLVGLWLDGRNAARAMIAAGHGRAYGGGPRAGWCG